MSKKYFSFLGIFLIITLINIYLSQNIITSWQYDKVQMYEIQKLSKILTSQIMEKVTDLPEFTEDTIKISNLKISAPQISLYDSYLNFNTGLLLFTPNKVSLSFTFSYSSSGSSGTASFDLKINLVKLRLKNNKKEQTQSVQVFMHSSENDFSVYEIADKELAAKVKTALYKGFENNKILQEHIANKIDVIKYYQDFYKEKKSLDFVTSASFGSKKISINLNRFVGFCEDVKGTAQTALCYYSGELEQEDKTDKSQVPLKNNDFVKPNDTYNTFINMDLYNSITKQIMKDGLKEIDFNSLSAQKTLKYDFTAASLKKYFNGLEAYDDKQNYELKIKINELNYKNVEYDLKFNIGNKNDVFTLDVEMETTLKIDIIRNVRINICSDGIKSLNISVKNGNISIKDREGLKKAIEEYLVNEPMCLTDNGISLRDYYSIITKAYAQEEGFYLEGNQLYQ